MAIQPPRLDDRNLADLRNELLRRIPVHAPQWTDHNATDPGIALVELFAALGEDLLYRFNRIPEAARLEFLRLLGISLLPAQAAKAQVQLQLPANSSEPVLVEFNPQTPRLTLAAGEVLFQAMEEVTVLPIECAVWMKSTLNKDAANQLQGVQNVTSLIQNHLKLDVNKLEVIGYEALPLPLPEAGVLPPGLNTAVSVDTSLWICLLASKTAFKKELGQPSIGEKTARDNLIRKLAGKVLNLGVRVDARLCGATDHFQCPEPGLPPTRWPLQWMISTGRFKQGGQKGKADQALYRDLSIINDTSNDLLENGTVRILLPQTNVYDSSSDGLPFANWTADSFDPPDEDLLGVAELPPRLDDPDLAERVLAWIRVRRDTRTKPSHPPAIKLRWLAANVVMAQQEISAGTELLGYGTARPGQRFRLTHTPIVAGSASIQVRGPQDWENWREVEDLALAGPGDPFYTLDLQEGIVCFGDGVHGRVPLPSQAIRVLTYRYGGGAVGNVGAERLTRIQSGPNEALSLKATNPLAAEGGVDTESQEHAISRIPQFLRHRDRAVALEDFEQLALATPAAGIGRAHCLPRHMPDQRVDGVPGVVTLIVIPAYDPQHPDEPTPDREQQRKVSRHLEPRRLVTTELFVTPPQYVPLSCSVAVEATPGYGVETLQHNVELAVRQLLAPLPPYGPEAGGWPFGRTVRDADLRAAVNRVQGVYVVHALQLKGWAIDATGGGEAVENELPLRKWQLPSLKFIRVDVLSQPELELATLPRLTPYSSATAPTTPLEGEITPPGDSGTPQMTPVQVPIQRETC
jgi:hypothetical protein